MYCADNPMEPLSSTGKKLVDTLNLKGFTPRATDPLRDEGFQMVRGKQKPQCSMTTTCTGQNAAQRGFHPTRNPSTGRVKVPPPVPLLPAVPFWTSVSAGMNHMPLWDAIRPTTCGNLNVFRLVLD